MSTPRCASVDAMVARGAAWAPHFHAFEAILRVFVRRCEAGEVRSHRTYAAAKAALARYDADRAARIAAAAEWRGPRKAGRMSTRIGDWMQTRSGRQFYPLDPRPNDIDIGDIAHALAHCCRFGGHVREFYSVAQHSVLVARQCPPDLRLWGLLHDASEAYLGDMVRPLKLHMTEYKTAEKKVMTAVIQHFGLPAIEPPLVKYYDAVLCVTEGRDLMGNPDWAARGPLAPLKEIIKPLAPDFARNEFLNYYAELTAGKAVAV